MFENDYNAELAGALGKLSATDEEIARILPPTMSTRENAIVLPPRPACPVCRRPLIACYCPLIKPFASHPRFAILTQPREAKHRLGTGRMAHLCISNSLLIEGANFSDNEQVDAIIRDRNVFSVVLYPGDSSINLSKLSRDQKKALIPRGKEIVVFVLDGTWTTARKMLRMSRNLAGLPAVSFDAFGPSNYRIRRQPRPDFYSTLEAIHHAIDIFALEDRASTILAPHDNLLEVFHYAVNRQLAYTP